MPPLTTDPPLPQKRFQSAHASGSNAARSAGGGGVSQPSSAPHASPSHTSDSHNKIFIYTPPLHIDGIFAGKLMKFALTVEQEPLFGRRKTEKDRRPLCPAPIIRLRAVECRDEPDSPSHEGIAEADPVDVFHLVCAAELLPPPDQSTHGKRHPPVAPKTSSRSGKGGKAEKRRRQEMEMDSGEDSETLENGDARAGDMSPVEERNLYGNLHVSGVRVLDLVGSPGTWFFFTDLYVRQEGRYSIRFRCFDTSAVTGSNRVVPHLAECRSQPFSIYPPRQMPSLPKPTELAEHFANQGFKLNSRKNEKTATSSPPPYFHSTAARGETNRPIKQMTGNEPSRPEPNPVQRDITHDGSSSAAASRSGSTVLTASSASMADGS